MLTHIVIWKYRKEVTEEEIKEHIALLRRLPSVIPNITSFHVGSDILGLPRSYDTGLVAVFPDSKALDEYTIHPEHIKVADFGRSVSEHVASVDFVDEE